ncbi:MAG TPA: nucleotide exchange factor GrpE [Polyangiaceae bacterium]|nr:nucleotide exchange factor GrpE [Polyangiaceae bacterium]
MATNDQREGEGAEASRAEPTSTAKEGGREQAETPSSPLEEAQAEIARLRDQLLRTAADFDNFRKRTRRELDDAHKRGKEELVRDLLPVFDNLERAVVHAGQASDAKAVADGVGMVLKQFQDTLSKVGINRIAAVGGVFDPSLHEAIQQVETSDHPAGTIVAEVQPGYAMGDRLLRAAMVVVAKARPKSDAEKPEQN